MLLKLSIIGFIVLTCLALLSLFGSIFFLCLGKVIVHALDEKARAYYNLEGLWTRGTIQNEPDGVSTKLAYIVLTCKIVRCSLGLLQVYYLIQFLVFSLYLHCHTYQIFYWLIL